MKNCVCTGGLIVGEESNLDCLADEFQFLNTDITGEQITETHRIVARTDKIFARKKMRR